MVGRRQWARGGAALVLAALLTPAGTPGTAGPAGAPGPSATTDSGRVRAAVGASVDPALDGLVGSVPVVVQGQPGGRDEVQRAVRAADGHVLRELPLVQGVAATVPGQRVRALAADPAVRAVSLDRALVVQGALDDESDRTSDYHGATRVDELRSTGLDGSGATVALLDTGVSPDVAPLTDRLVPVDDGVAGSMAPCKDLSGEGSCRDGFGHGTFLAGLIAGEPSAEQPLGGVAPGARVLSVKVAGRDGSTDVSTVLAGIQWVVSFRERYGIDVLNLSLGTDSTQPYRDDPLNYAVERAWAEGIVVVVSAANRGPHPGTVTKPGDDPFVLTVGAVDDRGTPAHGDDRLPDFSSRGPTADGLVKPDLVAPGARLVSLRAPGSLIDEEHPVDGTTAYRRGSGTSMATAVVSGVAALLAQGRPDLDPDEVKHALRVSARPVASDDPNAVGAGLVDAHAATSSAPPGRANGELERSNGAGSLVAARGTLTVAPATLPGTVLTGSTTAQLLLWDPAGYTTGVWSGPTWYTSPHGTVAWPGTSWAGDNWGGDNWGGDNWGGSTWQGEQATTEDYGRPGPVPGWYGAWDG